MLTLLGKKTSFFFFFNYYSLFFGFVWVFLAVRRLSLVAASKAALHCGARPSHFSGCSSLRSMGSRREGFSSCGTWALERRLSSCGTRA